MWLCFLLFFGSRAELVVHSFLTNPIMMMDHVVDVKLSRLFMRHTKVSMIGSSLQEAIKFAPNESGCNWIMSLNAGKCGNGHDVTVVFCYFIAIMVSRLPVRHKNEHSIRRSFDVRILIAVRIDMQLRRVSTRTYERNYFHFIIFIHAAMLHLFKQLLIISVDNLGCWDNSSPTKQLRKMSQTIEKMSS